MRFAGKTVVVTAGGGRGLGYHLVKAFNAEGARVLTCDLREDGVSALKAELPGVEAIVADVGTEEGCAQLLERVPSGVDILCNNVAARVGVTPLLEQTVADWEASFAVGVDAPFRLMKAVLPGMIERGDGAIVNTASVAGLRGGRGGTGYTAAKFALVGMTMNVAATYAGTGVRCNAICPGPMAPAGETHLTAVDVLPGLSEQGRRILTRDARKPARAPAEEVARLAVFLASDEARRINGACIPVDDGWIAF